MTQGEDKVIKVPEIFKSMEMKGNGKFYFSEFDKTFKFPFVMKQELSKESIIFVELGIGEEFSKFLIEKKGDEEEHLKCSIEGELESGMHLQIKEAYFVGSDIKDAMSILKFKIFSNIIIGENKFEDIKGNEEIHFQITNLEFLGTEKTVLPRGGWKLDRGRINVGGYELIFKQLENYDNIIKLLKKELKDIGAFTTEIIIKTSLKNHEEVEKVVNKICSLISFAKGVDVMPSTSYHMIDEKIIWKEIISIGKRPFRAGDFLIHYLPPEDLFAFIETSYPNYAKYEEEFGLQVLFNLYTSMKSAFYMELRCLIGYVLLETLGENLQNFYYKEKDPIQGSVKWEIKDFKKLLPIGHNLKEEDIEKIIQKISYNKPSLQDSINRIERDFKFLYRSEDKKLFEYRKFFIHKGKFPDGVDKVKTYREIISFIDRVILSILAYKGNYCDISKGYKIEKMTYSS